MRALLIKTFFLALIAMPFVISQAMAQQSGQPDGCIDASGTSRTVVVGDRS